MNKVFPSQLTEASEDSPEALKRENEAVKEMVKSGDVAALNALYLKRTKQVETMRNCLQILTEVSERAESRANPKPSEPLADSKAIDAIKEIALASIELARDVAIKK